MESGKGVRGEKLSLRDTMEEKKRKDGSRVICEKFLQQSEVIGAESIFIYVSYRSEVSTIGLIKELLKRKKRISVPITYVDKGRMDAIEITNISSDLAPGYCGIPEPKKEIIEERYTDPATIDLVVVPGSVFDKRGGRFGYGGGYYDKYLGSIPKALRYGFAFDIQIENEISLQPHDQIMDKVITEKRTCYGRMLKGVERVSRA